MSQTLIRFLKLSPIVLIVSLFVSLVVIGAGIGSVYPQVFAISAPVVCSGKLAFESRDYSYRPGQSGTEQKIYCVTRGGEREVEITMYAFVVSSVIYAVLLFPLLLLGLFMIGGGKRRSNRTRRRGASSLAQDSPAPATSSTSKRLAELDQLKESGLITEDEYREKRSDILEDL